MVFNSIEGFESPQIVSGGGDVDFGIFGVTREGVPVSVLHITLNPEGQGEVGIVIEFRMIDMVAEGMKSSRVAVYREPPSPLSSPFEQIGSWDGEHCNLVFGKSVVLDDGLLSVSTNIGGEEYTFSVPERLVYR